MLGTITSKVLNIQHINKSTMKRIILTLCAISFTSLLMAQSPDVTIKRGKAILDEEYYYQLKQKADAYNKMVDQNEDLQKKLDIANNELKKNQPHQIKTFNDSASYAIGKDIATSWQQQKLGINLDIVAQSLSDMARGKNNWSRQTMNPILQRFQREFEQRQQKKQQEMMASLDKNKEEGAKFLKENANNKSVYTTKSGLQYRKLKDGNGNRPTANSTVKVHYTGKLIDGTIFDSSVERGEPMEFPVGAVIPGWTEGLQLMDEGSKYMLYIPYNLAYGENPAGEIPPGSTLIFEVELIKIIK